MAKFPTYEEMAKNVAEKALDELLYDGRSIREWIQIITSEDCISRQDFDKFLEDAEKEAAKNRKYVFASALNTIRGNLRNFPSTQPEQRWIPISKSERLPKDGERIPATHLGWIRM